MGYDLKTKGGYDFYEVASLLQKSLRRNDIALASRAANEMFPHFANYVWNRLMTVSAEDCSGIITVEIVALHDAWRKINDKKKDKSKGRVFIAKAIVLLARARHSRDADELNILVSDRMPEKQFKEAVKASAEAINVPSEDLHIPNYVYDVHTWKGKAAGKTKRMFLREESEDLVHPSTVFANLREMIEHRGYLEPEIDLETEPLTDDLD